MKRIIKKQLIRSSDALNRPKNTVLLVTNPRSGSTWLFDSLRVHPNVYFHRRAVVFRDLQLISRRYPKGLKDAGVSSTLTEVTAGGEVMQVPELTTEKPFPRKQLGKAWNIEKVHPAFYNYNNDQFLSALDRASCKTSYKVILLLRNPEASIRSFLNYQSRNPSWFSELDYSGVMTYMENTYRSIFELGREDGFLSITYEQIKDSYEASMHKVFKYLWPQAEAYDQSLRGEDIAKAKKITSRETRQRAAPQFLGAVEGQALDNFSKFKERYATELGRCIDYYEKFCKRQ